MVCVEGLLSENSLGLEQLNVLTPAAVHSTYEVQMTISSDFKESYFI